MSSLPVVSPCPPSLSVVAGQMWWGAGEEQLWDAAARGGGAADQMHRRAGEQRQAGGTKAGRMQQVFSIFFIFAYAHQRSVTHPAVIAKIIIVNPNPTGP